MNTRNRPPPAIHHELNSIFEKVYRPCGYQYSHIQAESESQEYGAATFRLDDFTIKFRVAKVTPTKIGQFVTLWKRDKAGLTVPHDISDPIDLFVISTRSGNHFGQFVFPKNVFAQRGVLSKSSKGGKRGIRVYPPWDQTQSQQAQATQKWQLEFFLRLDEPEFDRNRARFLYGQQD